MQNRLNIDAICNIVQNIGQIPVPANSATAPLIIAYSFACTLTDQTICNNDDLFIYDFENVEIVQGLAGPGSCRVVVATGTGFIE